MSAAHIYWRVVTTTTNSGNGAALAAVELRSAIGGSNLALTGTGTASASSAQTPASNAFDGNATTHWASNALNSNWIQWAFSSPQSVAQLALQNWSLNTNLYVKDGRLEWSDDGVVFTTYLSFSDRLGTVGLITTHNPIIPGNASAILTAPAPTLYASGGANAVLTAPTPTLVAFGAGGAAVTAPVPKLSFTAHAGYGENALIVTAPTPTLSSYGGTNAALTAPSPTLTSAATVTALAMFDLIAPVPTIDSTGVVAYSTNVALTAPIPYTASYGGGGLSATAPAGTVTASGTMGGVAQAALTAPAPTVTLYATAQNFGGAHLVAPAGQMAVTLQAVLTAPVPTLVFTATMNFAVAYEAYALNLKHDVQNPIDEMTRYTNFPFTHVVRYKNSYYGVAAGGLYLLEGTTDAGAPIAWQFKTGITDFGTANLKTVSYAYFGGRFGPGATVSIYPGESGGNSYSYTTPRGQAAQNYRQQFGRGLKARYFAVGASGTDALELDSLELITDTLSRRI